MVHRGCIDIEKLVFISSPYSAEYDWEVTENVKKAMEAARKLLEEGFYPYCPHLNHYLDSYCKEQGNEFPYDLWVDHGIAFLGCCDAIIYLGYSNGCNKELAYAIENGLSVYFSVEEFLSAQGKDCTTIS